ncbi:NAD(P)/FAD-dependent oxidoreductase [Nonomuraea sp. CA-141351]|uniref:NAD(P)/FAD-dependent oxidoreductase n=1 Tax=Nonomuraea sp. CA-141351 TaxID=3239996 RepID=UPI003D94FD06
MGGGVVGAATTWHLLEAEPSLTVAVIEPDPSHELAASSAASGGIRQLFTRPENVLMSQYTHEIIDRWSTWTAPDGSVEGNDVPDLAWRRQGYLFVAGTSRAEQLRLDYEQHVRLGVDAQWLEPERLRELYEHLHTEDLGAAILSPGDGWLDPHSFLRGMTSRARRLGATMIKGRAVGFETAQRRVTAVRLESGGTVEGESFVNVAGVWGPGLSAQLGLHLPVEPMRRYDHYVETKTDFTGYPFIKDPAGLAVRPESVGLTAALVDFDAPAGFDLSIDPSYFEDVVWPALVERVPATDQLKLVSTWAGLYDQNRLDGNMILDRWSGRLDNYYFATGFSGHGLMHAPAVGRALTELIVTGSFQTLDLTRMGLARIISNSPYRELSIR